MTRYKSGKELSTKSMIVWRAVQSLVFLVGLFIFLALIFYPSLGLTLLWNVLVPIAPLLLVVSAGLWRNICPLATANLLPRHLNLSKKKKMSVKMQSVLALISVLALYIIVPLRHVLFNTNGMSTAIMFLIAVMIGLSMGLVYDWKSGWCSSLCPIHPVEKLYGGNTIITLPNAHCDSCVKCSLPCPDSTQNVSPKAGQKNIYQKISSYLIIGGFPGFVWGWFQVPDFAEGFTSENLFQSFYPPFAGLFFTLIIYSIFTTALPKLLDRTLTNIFAATAVSCYYWYRIPNLFGFGQFENDGMLINFKNLIPAWIVTSIALAMVLFFFYWLVFRKTNKKSWVVRPSYLN